MCVLVLAVSGTTSVGGFETCSDLRYGYHLYLLGQKQLLWRILC